MKKFFTGIWGIWVITTFVYVVWQITLDGALSSVFNILGLFVPFGFWNTVSSLDYPLGFLIGIFGLILASMLVNKLELKTPLRILVSLVLLLLITCAVDITIWGRWCSYYLSTQPNYICEGVPWFSNHTLF